MKSGNRVQAKVNGHRGTLTRVRPGHSFTVRYDGERDHKNRRVRGQKVTYRWHRAGAFNFGHNNPGAQDG